MQFPQATGFQRDDGGRNGGGDGEGGRVHNAQRTAAAGDLLEGMVFGVVYIRGVAGQRPVAAYDVLVLGTQRAVLDVGAGRGHVAEDGLGQVEVLGQDRYGGVRDPVVEVECGPVSTDDIWLDHATGPLASTKHRVLTQPHQSYHHQRRAGIHSRLQGLSSRGFSISECGEYPKCGEYQIIQSNEKIAYPEQYGPLL